ncbi:hypothetical protein NDA01_19990 [Trichocoleus desertorum AS-A10]
MALAEELGMEQYQKRVRIFASDVDTEAVHQAQHGHYSMMQMANIPVAMRERYFEPDGTSYRMCSALRSPLRFCQHNLLEDPPMSHVDLIVCRNVLMYFNQMGKTKVLKPFYRSLNRTGVLFIGSADALPQENRLFNLLSVKHRMLSKAEKWSFAPHLPASKLTDCC